VGEILRMWTGTITGVQDFLTFINSFYPSIKFTLEIGGKQIVYGDMWQSESMPLIVGYENITIGSDQVLCSFEWT